MSRGNIMDGANCSGHQKGNLCGTLYHLSLSKFLLRNVFDDIQMIVIWVLYCRIKCYVLVATFRGYLLPPDSGVGKGYQCIGLTTLSPSSAKFLEILGA